MDKEMKEKYDGLDLVSLAMVFKEMKEHMEKATEHLQKVSAVYEYLRMVAVPAAVEKSGLETPVKIAGVGKISIANDAWVTTKAGDKEGLYEWLNENGFHDLIKPTVNASTLKSLVMKALLNGDDYPEEFVEVKPFQRASLLK